MKMEHEFVIENYNAKKPFTSFLPGIAGLNGKPLWTFYVNRGQCMASFGRRDKDGAIMEFYPANISYRRTPLEGFRTFIKLNHKGKKVIYEPFRLREFCPRDTHTQTLYVLPYEFRIEEISEKHSLKTEIIYFTVPGEDFPALARIVRVTNLSPHAESLEIIDGMPKICPFGMNEFFMKHMSRTIEAWMETEGVGRKTPFYKLKVNAADVSRIERITGGAFYLSMDSGGGRPGIIADPASVFGDFGDLTYPGAFAGNEFNPHAPQRTKNITPSAFSHCRASLPGGGKYSISSLIGHAASAKKLKRVSAGIKEKFFRDKRAQNKTETEKISSSVRVFSGMEKFDAYAEQTNLDNTLRGGYPVIPVNRKKPIYVFNRKHGDPERDYNDFVLEPELYSQGDGNFRDTNQNRRNSVWIKPDIGAKDINDFYNLIQLDGFNPLVIKPYKSGRISAEHKEGYWIDHWTYNLDLLESYGAIFPERITRLLFAGKDFLFFDSPYRVKPRSGRYVKDARGNVRQYNCVYLDEEKEKLVNSRKREKSWVRTKSGTGVLYGCSLAAKILTIIVNKMASLDPSGRGMEMEADKPGWCDSLNGLPGIMGSSLCEAAELLRLVVFLKKTLNNSGRASVRLPREVSDFLDGLLKELGKNRKAFSARANISYWKNSNALKERYREKVRFGVNGREKEISREKIAEFLSLSAGKLENGIRRSKNREGIPYTYFVNNPRRFTARPLPLFLEGPVHVLKMEKDKSRALRLYKNIKNSALYDKKLGMYKLNVSVASEPLEIGRTRVFTPGWLENESVWLHMEYKYLLEVLRSGLYGEFYDDFKTALIPFQDPGVYGRSVFENSTFLVSSEFFDKSLHGTGFVARLTGATSEFLTMLRIMNLGKNPFLFSESGVIFKPVPVLHKTLFTKKGRTIEFDFGKTKKNVNIPKNSYAFSLFGNTLIVYKNPGRKNTFGRNKVAPVQFTIKTADGKKSIVKRNCLKEPFSTRLREGKIEILSVLLG